MLMVVNKVSGGYVVNGSNFFYAKVNGKMRQTFIHSWCCAKREEKKNCEKKFFKKNSKINLRLQTMEEANL